MLLKKSNTSDSTFLRDETNTYGITRAEKLLPRRSALRNVIVIIIIIIIIICIVGAFVYERKIKNMYILHKLSF